MYVPNVGKWMKYYQDVVQGKENAYVNNVNRNVKQWGGGISQNANEFMIPIDKNNNEGEKSLPAREIDVNMVSPAQQVVEQAKSALKRHRRSSSRHLSAKRCRVRTSKRQLKSVKRKQTKKSRRQSTRKPTRKSTKKASKKSSKKRHKSRNLISQWLR